MQVLSYNSRKLITQEQKLSNQEREFCAITFVALSQYEFVLTGSNFPITIFTHHISILFLFTGKGNLTPMQTKITLKFY